MLKHVTKAEAIVLKGIYAAQMARAAHGEDDLWVTADRIKDAGECLCVTPGAIDAILVRLEDRGLIVQRDAKPLAYALTRTGEVLVGMVEALREGSEWRD